MKYNNLHHGSFDYGYAKCMLDMMEEWGDKYPEIFIGGRTYKSAKELITAIKKAQRTIVDNYKESIK